MAPSKDVVRSLSKKMAQVGLKDEAKEVRAMASDVTDDVACATIMEPGDMLEGEQTDEQVLKQLTSIMGKEKATQLAKRALRVADGSSAAKAKMYLEYLQSAGEEAVLKAMNSGKTVYGVFPSGWGFNFRGVPYPAWLASILVKSRASDSITDLANPFYSSRGRKLEPEAAEIFRKDVLANIKKTRQVIEYGIASMPSLAGLLKAEKDTWKKLFMAMSDAQVRSIISSCLFYDSPEELKKAFDTIGAPELKEIVDELTKKTKKD